jgi:hypothetical protein
MVVITHFQKFIRFEHLYSYIVNGLMQKLLAALILWVFAFIKPWYHFGTCSVAPIASCATDDWMPYMPIHAYEWTSIVAHLKLGSLTSNSPSWFLPGIMPYTTMPQCNRQ